ncbi:MAG: GDSL family lipase [Ruminococcaceae bacterium]|nr:GDSL family lipase [Oscillospiraceae bacterium]
MRILFQGDSITDCGRNRERIDSLGAGYPKFVAELLTETYNDIDFEFINKGCGGHQTKDLMARWQEDTIDIDPDIMTLLVGINDTWHHCDAGDFIPAEVFEANYRSLLDDVKSKTNAKIIMLETFLLDVGGKESFFPDMDSKMKIIRRLAREYAVEYIPLDGLFASASVTEEPSFWSEDGVHPTEEGHKLIADYVYNAICDIIDEQAMDENE